MSPAFLITFTQLDKPIIIAILIFIMPYIYLLLCYKPIREKLQRIRVPPHHIVTQFVCFKVIRGMFQLPWACFNGLVAYLLSFKRSATTYSRHATPWVFFNGFFIHFYCLKMVNNMPQCIWFSAHCLFTYLFFLSMVWYIF